MDVLLSEDEELLRDALRRFFDAECDAGRVRAAEDAGAGADPQLWHKLGELGWLGLALPAMAGGADAPMTDLVLLFEEAGRALAPVPLHGHTVAGLTLARCAAEAQRSRLADAATGRARLAFAYAEGRPGIGPGSIQLQAVPDGNGWRLNGVKHFVDGFDGADTCLLPVRTRPGSDGAGLTLVLVDPRAEGVTARPHNTLAGDPQWSVSFEQVFISGDDVVGTPDEAGGAIEAMFDTAVLLNTAMVVGATRRAVERAVDYAKERHAFGKPIGQFQAIAHMCANMITWVDGAELLTREAAWQVAAGCDARLAIATAKAFANERCQAALREANQIHGGLAQVREHDQQLWYRRAAAWTMRLGTSVEHRKTIARCLALGQAAQSAEADNRGVG